MESILRLCQGNLRQKAPSKFSHKNLKMRRSEKEEGVASSPETDRTQTWSGPGRRVTDSGGGNNEEEQMLTEL